MSISVPPIGDDAKRIGAYFTPLAVNAQANPNMTVRINPGSFYTALGEHKEYVGGNSPTIAAPTTAGAKWVVIALNENALIEVFNGAVGSSPQLPTLPENVLPLAGVFVGDTATVITSDMVFDLRPLWQVRPENVPNLAGELAARPTIGDVNALLALKADVDGTPETQFVLNKDHVGVPGADAELVVERGANPNVAIRWNETTEAWEFTNDGVTYDPIGAASGVYYTKVELDTGALDPRYYTKIELDGGVLNVLYYTEAEVNALLAGKADVAHTHVVADITDFVAGVGANAPVKTVAGKLGHVTLVEADITDLDKYATVPAATVGNFVEFGTGALADSGYSSADFATATHTHVAADVTDFDAAADARIAASSIDDHVDVNAYIGPSVNGHTLVWRGGSYDQDFVRTDDLGDITSAGAVDKDVLIHNGSLFEARALLSTDLADFVEGNYVHTYAGVGSPVPAEDIYGVKTFNDDIIINGNLTVTGTDTELLTNELRIQDKFFDVNWGETGAGVGGVTPQDAGMRVKRGTEPDALFFWEESTNQWMAGVVGSANPIITGAHSHMVSDIIDFPIGFTTQLALNPLDGLLDVVYPTAPIAGDYLRHDGATWVNSVFATDVTAELNVNSITEMADVDTTGVAEGNVMFYEGSPAQWVPRDIVKADVADLNEADYVLTNVGVGSPVPSQTVYGDKVFADDVTVGGNVIVTGDLTVNGTNNVINVDTLTVEDNIIEVNKGETGAGVGGGAGNAGIQVDRGTLPDALLVWDELNSQWEAGTVGSTTGISLDGHLHILTDITDVTATALEVNQLNGIALGPTNTVQNQLNDKISRTGDVMNATANLTFSGGGQVLGLPAVPSATAAASKEYVDATVAMYDELRELNDTNISGETVGEFLAWAGSPGAWVNRLIVEADISDLGTTIVLDTDIGSTVQAWDAGLDSLAGLAAASGNMIYATAADTYALVATTAFGRGLLNETDAASTRTTLEVYSQEELLPTGSPAVSVLDARYYTEAELDGGQLNSLYYTETELDGTAGVAGAKIDKVAGAVAGNVATMLADGQIADGGTLLSALALTANHYTKTENDAAPGSAGAKVDKVAGTVGNLVEFGAAGAIADSGLVSANVLTTASVLNDLADVTDASSTGDLLQKTGGGQWQNIAPASITQFVHTQGSVAESITGIKTFNDDVIVNGDLVVNGTTTSVDSINMQVEDKNIVVNNGYVGPTSGSTGAGITVTRNAGSPGSPEGSLVWDDSLQNWKGGLIGSEVEFAQVGVAVAQPDYEVQTAGVTQTTFTTSLNVATPTGSKAAEQVFVNGIKQIPGAAKHYTVSSYAPLTVNFTAGNEPPTGADVEFYAFGTIS